MAQRVPRRGASSKPEGKSTGKWVAAAFVLLLLIGGGAYAFYPSEDPAVARIADLRTQMEGADDAKRRELWGKMGEEFRNMSPETREKMRDEWEARREAREAKELGEFFALSPAEQKKKLDEDIKEDEQRRKEWEKRRAERSKEGNGNRGPQMGGRGGDGGGGGDRGGGRGRVSNGDPNARSKRYLDRTPAPTRAMRSEYRRMREERRKQLGLANR